MAGPPRTIDLHFGIVTPPVPGHIHPFCALGRELIERGHRVTVFHAGDIELKIRDEGLEFTAIGAASFPLGSLGRSLDGIAGRKGFAALRFTIGEVARTTEMMLRDAPPAIRATGVDMLLVDQTEPAGGTIAEFLGIPFVTVCNALALNRESDVPPPFSPWAYHPAWWARLRNQIGYAISDRVTAPIWKVVADYRKLWKLKAHRSPDDSFSTVAQISQQPALFDFPRRSLPAQFHYTGPLRKRSPIGIPFPWEKLDGRPLVYASLGTLQNRRFDVFHSFAAACADLDAQLVITHGGGLKAAEVSGLPGNPVIVPYAPQLELLARASLTLTHAGLNTVLDSLIHGVPMVAVPITFEQPAIAARLRHAGAGEVVSLSDLKTRGLRHTVRRVLMENSYRLSAKRIAESIRAAGGVARAAEIILDGAARSGSVSA